MNHTNDMKKDEVDKLDELDELDNLDNLDELDELQGDSKKRKNSPFITRTVVANKLCKGITNSFFLLKTEIQMQISNTEPFLYIFRGRRYLTIKMGL